MPQKVLVYVLGDAPNLVPYIMGEKKKARKLPFQQENCPSNEKMSLPAQAWSLKYTMRIASQHGAQKLWLAPLFFIRQRMSQTPYISLHMHTSTLTGDVDERR